jgi:hypothetical protein
MHHAGATAAYVFWFRQTFGAMRAGLAINHKLVSIES